MNPEENLRDVWLSTFRSKTLLLRTGLFCAGYISRTFYVQQMKKSNTCSVERRLKKEPNRTLKLLRTLHYCLQVARTGLKAIPCCLFEKKLKENPISK